jgi:hypothetical protein
VDTTKFQKDGEVYVHYLIYDEAGNVSYRQERLVILNNLPILDKITLTTNPRRTTDPADTADRTYT